MKILALLWTALSISAFAAKPIPAGLIPESALTWTKISPKAKLWVLNSRSGEPFGEATWHFTDRHGELTNLKAPPFPLHTIFELAASPDGKWLAVGSAGEGHPMVHVTALGDLLASKTPTAKRQIDPYPGSIRIVGWRNGKLALASDRALSVPPKEDGRFAEEVPGGREATFWLDVDTGVITRSNAR